MEQQTNTFTLDDYGTYTADDYDRGNDIFDYLMVEVHDKGGTLEDFITRWRGAVATLYHIARMDERRQAYEDSGR